MMHEQSETIQRPRGYYNVYGGTEYPIPKEFSFENQPYATQEQAVQSARWRSRMDAGHYVGASPSYGFSNSYQPSSQAQALGAVLNALQDPRNQWMGTGMAGGTIRGLGRLRNYFADKEAIKMGGFRPSLKEMKTASPDIAPTGPNRWKGSIGNERAWNDAYIANVKMGNDAVDALRASDPMTRTVANEMYRAIEHSNPSYAEQINQTMIGRQQLEDLNKRAFSQTEGPPPEMIRRLFGLKE